MDQTAAGAAGGTDSTEAGRQHHQTGETQPEQQMQQVCLIDASPCPVHLFWAAAAAAATLSSR